MTFVTLFSSEHGFIASDQRVFSPDELEPLKNVMEQARLLDQRLGEQQEHEQAALSKAAEQGRIEGLAEGRVEAAEHLAAEIKQLQDQHRQSITEVKGSCAELAVDIVRKIAGSIEPPRMLLAQAQQAAEQVLDEPNILLRVHPSQLDAVQELLRQTDQSRIQSAVADEALAEQACVLDTGHGQIDIALDTQLNAVLEMFEETPLDTERSHG
ncbi:MAG: hypothetical protein KTR32_33400 [Granulosicoccus sp.]|nr:hypothetical protein [Granulosicoccus sp.]